MKTNTTSPIVPTLKPAAITTGGFTIGLELDDRSDHVCVLDADGQIVREGALPKETRPPSPCELYIKIPVSPAGIRYPARQNEQAAVD